MTAPTIVKPLDALRDFITDYIVPCPEKIYRSWLNRVTVDNVSSYAVLTLLNTARQGTNIHLPIIEDDQMTDSVKMLTLYDIQVDFCADDEQTACSQANTLCMLMRDGIAVNYFADYGISVQYAENPRSMPKIDQKQWEIRYTLTVRLAAWTESDFVIDSFNAVTVGIENVDVHHKP